VIGDAGDVLRSRQLDPRNPRERLEVGADVRIAAGVECVAVRAPFGQPIHAQLRTGVDVVKVAARRVGLDAEVTVGARTGAVVGIVEIAEVLDGAIDLDLAPLDE
jgi:hypothetical protein